MTISDAARDRYLGQLRVPAWTEAVQERLGAASAIVVDARPRGCAAATHLAAAGVGRLGLVDGGRVTSADMHGGSLHLAPDAGAGRADSAAAKLGLLNPDVRVEAYPVAIEDADGEAIVTGAGVVVDCSPTSRSRAVVNAACCATRAPLVTGGADGLEGFVLASRPGESACHECAFPGSDATEERAAGVVAGLVGAVQALEAIKLLTLVAPPRLGEVVRIDGAGPTSPRAPVARRPDCPACAGVATEPQSG